MEACQAGVAEGVKGHAEKLLNIFQSDLFQALLGKLFLHQRVTTATQHHNQMFVLWPWGSFHVQL